MQVTMLFFAAARDATGCSRDCVELPAHVIEIGDLNDWLGVKYPSLLPYLACLRIAQNEQFAASSAKISPGDVLAIIPPVAGG